MVLIQLLVYTQFTLTKNERPTYRPSTRGNQELKKGSYLVRNCKVLLPDDTIGLVRETRGNQNNADVSVALGSKELKWFKESDLKNGFDIDNFVVHVPPTGTGQSLGFGKIISIKKNSK